MRNLLLIVALGLVLYSCDNSTNSTEVDLAQPEIPPVGTLAPDLSGIENTNNMNGKSKLRATTDTLRTHFNQAVQQGRLIGGFLSANVALPASLLAAASATAPEQTAPNVWVWTFTHNNPLTGGTLNSELTATVDLENGVVDWQLLLISSGNLIEFQDFAILTGQSVTTGTSGTWEVGYFNPQAQEQLSVTRNEWIVQQDSLSSLKSTILLNFSPLVNDTFSFTKDDSTRQLQFTDVSENTMVDIMWRISGEGRIIDPDFNNGNPACWDTDKKNVECEQVGL